MTPAEPQEGPLQIAARPISPFFFADRQTEDVRLANRPAQFPVRDQPPSTRDPAKIGNRASGSGDRNAVMERDISRDERNASA